MISDDSPSLQEIDRIYQRMGIKELVVYPWYDKRDVLWGDGSKSTKRNLAGLITGVIDEYAGWPGKTAFLEHFIVLPEAQNKLAVMQQMPKAIAVLLRKRGVARIALCIDHSDPRRVGLSAWARRCGFTFAGVRDESDWFTKPTKGKRDGQENKDAKARAAARSASASAPAAARATRARSHR